MNTRKVSIIALILMLAMALAACGGTASAGTQNPETSSQDAASSSVADDDPATEAPPAADPADVSWRGEYRGNSGILTISDYGQMGPYRWYIDYTLESVDMMMGGIADITSADFCEVEHQRATLIFNRNDSVLPDENPDNDSIIVKDADGFDGEYTRYDDAASIASGSQSDGDSITDEPIAEGVVFGGSFLESDPGENMTPYEAASGLYYRILADKLEKGSDYSEELPMSITCVDVVDIDGEACYLLSVSGAFNTKAWEYAVCYDYDSQNIYLLQDGETTPLGSLLDFGSAKAYE